MNSRAVLLAGLVCADVRIGQTAYLDCLNEMFHDAAVPPRAGVPPNSVPPPAPAAGIFDRAAIGETLGPAFGHSVFPARPPVPVRGPPLR